MSTAWTGRPLRARVVPLLAVALLLAAVATPLRAVEARPDPSQLFLSRLSHAGLQAYWASHPGDIPPTVESQMHRLDAVRGSAAASALRRPGGPSQLGSVSELFNLDVSGLPQNEESVSVCRSDPRVVVGATNDLRGDLDPEGNTTGWSISTDGGRTVANDGRLPPVDIEGKAVTSSGDPVVVADDSCRLYAGSLANFRIQEIPDDTNGVGVYVTSPQRLASCPGGTDPACWPVRRAVAVGAPGHDLDKEWMDVGRSGSAGQVVWVAYTDFDVDGLSRIMAVRCDANVSHCTEPILISGDDVATQFADVTIGADGRVYISWLEYLDDNTVTIKVRVAQPGGVTFGPERVVAEEPMPLTFAMFGLNANDFRVNTYPKSAVVAGPHGPRLFMVWDACRDRVWFDFLCEQAMVKLTYSDNAGATWSPVKVLSVGGQNYFSTIDSDATGRGVAVAWFTSRFDPQFDNRQDVELVGIDPVTGAVRSRQRVTPVSNNPEADPYYAGLGFIGDYIEVALHDGVAYVHYNASYRPFRFVGLGVPVPQQDNFLAVRRV